MGIHGYGIYGERAYGLRVYVVSLYRGTKPVKSPWWWIRFSLLSAQHKGLLEVRRADRTYRP